MVAAAAAAAALDVAGASHEGGCAGAGGASAAAQRASRLAAAQGAHHASHAAGKPDRRGQGVAYCIGREPEAARRPGQGLWQCQQLIQLFCNRSADNCRDLLQKTYLHSWEVRGQ